MAATTTRTARGTNRASSKGTKGSNTTPLLWMAFALLVIVLDQFFKIVIVRTFAYGESRPVTRFFNLVLVYNKGAAFSFLADAGGWQRWFFTGLGVVVGLYIIWMLPSFAASKTVDDARSQTPAVCRSNALSHPGNARSPRGCLEGSRASGRGT